MLGIRILSVLYVKYSTTVLTRHNWRTRNGIIMDNWFKWHLCSIGTNPHCVPHFYENEFWFMWCLRHCGQIHTMCPTLLGPLWEGILVLVQTIKSCWKDDFFFEQWSNHTSTLLTNKVLTNSSEVMPFGYWFGCIIIIRCNWLRNHQN